MLFKANLALSCEECQDSLQKARMRGPVCPADGVLENLGTAPGGV